MKEKKLLSVKEIEAQTLLELPDRRLMGASSNSASSGALTQLFAFLLLIGA
jgi:hypothetical protein